MLFNRAAKMACVMRYSFLLISICLRSTKGADANVQVTPLIGAVGNEIIVQCATDKTPQDGVYMYKQDLGSKNKKNIFYFYKDKTLTFKKKMYEGKVHVDGNIPNLNATFSNVNPIDIGLYWCEFNFEDKLTVSTHTWLWIEKSVEKKDSDIEERTTEIETPERVFNKCPEDPNVKLILTVCAFMSLLSIIGFISVILKVKGCWGNKQYSPSNQPSDSVYEEMKRSNSDCPSTVRTFINPDYQSAKLLR
ncbi:uncharacterized protein LOC132160559 [Carassius carassius]|uniref:uncharacterized protein LOC132160559 n=1 Tax=Carassius carassius TaxID=217509 RepID=UPI0028697CC3|nr:uncharacterized protein LOC132160559 [Carassius carassius]